MSRTVAEIAALIHRDMCEDAANGYSWSPRWGEDGLGIKRLVIDGRVYQYDRGSYDCSSSVVTAWSEAVKYTRYKGCFDGATYTGNMLSVFLASGLFEKWDTDSTIAQPGDVYLNYSEHTAMCQSVEPDMLSEFCWGDKGAYGNKVGDQTGHESHVTGYYSRPWNCTLHYNGKAEDTPSKVLYGIDVSSNQPQTIVADVDNAFAIVKMSGNPQKDGSGKPLRWNYVNDSAKQQAKDAMEKHGLLGLYHFAYGLDAVKEADFFVEQVKKLGYLGKAMLVLDYEADAVSKGRVWVKRFCDRVKSKAGYAPVIYASGSVIESQYLGSLGYKVWCANYYRGYTPIQGYDTRGMKVDYAKAIMWQFTSQGYLKGYDGPLDMDAFFGTSADFKALMGPHNSSKEASKTEKQATPKKADNQTKPIQYRVFRDGQWRPWKQGGQTAGKLGSEVYDVEVRNLGKKGWFQLTLKGGKVLPKNALNVKRKVPVIGVTVYLDSPNADKEAVYRVFSGGKWLRWEHDDDGGGAGDDVHPVQCLQVKTEKC